MGVTQRFEIVIASGQTVFYAGQTIQGQLCVELAKDMKVKGISISCVSEARVFWRRGKQRYRFYEGYQDAKFTVYGDPRRGGEEVIISAGSHMFPFQFLLPVDLPGSFEGTPGSFVRHWLKAVIDRPWKSNKEYKLMYNVVSILDLNTLPEAELPFQTSASKKSICFGCFTDGEVSATFKVDKKGYVPGESIAIYGEVTDNANVGINCVFVILIRTTTYIAGSLRRSFDVCVGGLKHSDIETGGSDIWNGDKLHIPPVPPSFLPGCNIIDIQYFVKIEVNLPVVFTNIHLSIPVIIGTVPLHSTVQQSLALREQDHQHGHPPVTHQPQAITSSPLTPTAPWTSRDATSSNEMPLPTYEECMFGKVDTTDESEQYTAGNLKFAPSYTYYKNLS
ncbi:hypothetical protein ACF0H5_022151 [Mactra antiquata]